MPIKHAVTLTDPNSPLADHDDWNDNHVFAATLVTKAAVQSIPSGAWTALQFDTEQIDTDGWHDNVTNNSRITVGVTGVYSVSGRFQISSTDNGDLGIAIYKNGAVAAIDVIDMGASSTNRGRAIHQNLYLTAGDYVEIYVYQDSGAAKDTVVATTGFGVR